MLPKSKLVMLGITLAMAGTAYADGYEAAPLRAASALYSDHGGGQIGSDDHLLQVVDRSDPALASIGPMEMYRAITPGKSDSWLMLLAAGGLVVLQLRRKQKTLPQRPLI